MKEEVKYVFFMIVWQCLITDYLWINSTDAMNANCIGIMTVHVSGSLSARHQEFLAVNRLWYILCSCDDRMLPEVGRNIQLHPTAGSKRPSQLQKMYQSRCRAKNSWWRAERLPETCRVVIPMKLVSRTAVRPTSPNRAHVNTTYVMLPHHHTNFLHF